ncbi:MAG: hypothetical protein PVI91_15545 [Gammaproteobacteria bacterium]|jgi:hypothetical protein
MQSDEDMPKWDVALQGLALDAYQRKGAPLALEDFRRLANQHAIRFDDIMETMFLLVIHREWLYLNSAGRLERFDQRTLDNLYVKRRLSEKDVAAFDGGWKPLQR